jgi:hypothetical protein
VSYESDEQLRAIAAQAQIYQQQHAQDTSALIEVGRGNFGAREFDEASQALADAVGPRIREVVDVIRGFDKADAIIHHLANNPTRLEQFAKLNPERQKVEAARIEAQMSNFGHVHTGHQPAWKDPEIRNGRTTDDNWRRTGGANLSDKAWSREHDRRMAQRHKEGWR